MSQSSDSSSDGSCAGTEHSAASPNDTILIQREIIVALRNIAGRVNKDGKSKCKELKAFLKNIGFPLNPDEEYDYIFQQTLLQDGGWIHEQPVGDATELRWHTIYRLTPPEFQQELKCLEPLIKTLMDDVNFEFPTLGGKRKRKTVLKKYRKTVKRRSQKRKIYK